MLEKNNDKPLSIDQSTNKVVLANHEFNEERTIAYRTNKKTYKQDSISWVISGLVLFFLTILSVGRITVIGQFFDDSIFNLLFGWFKFPVYIILLAIDICIFSGIRFKFKKRFIFMVAFTTLLIGWIISLILLSVIYSTGKEIHGIYTIDKLWTKSIFSDSFNIYWYDWLDHSIYGDAYAKTSTTDFLMCSNGYANIYSGGGLPGMLIAGLTSYLSIVGSYILWAFLAFINSMWIFTGDPFFLFKSKNKRKGKALRILSLKSKSNPNSRPKTNNSIKLSEEKETIKTSEVKRITNNWEAMNIYGDDDDVVSESDLTVMLPSYKERYRNVKEEEINNQINDLFNSLNETSNEELFEVHENYELLKNDHEQIIEENSVSIIEPIISEPSIIDETTETVELETSETKSNLEPIIEENVDSSPIIENEEIDSDTEFFDNLYSDENEETNTENEEIIIKNETIEVEFANEEIGQKESQQSSTIENEQKDELINPEIIDESKEEQTSEMIINDEVQPEPEVRQKVNYANYKLPSLDLLKDAPKDWEKERKNKENAALKVVAIDEVFNQFGIKAKVHSTKIGPTITQFEIQLEPGTKVGSVTSLENDLKLALANPNIRLQAPIPGTNFVGIELPNGASEMISMKEILMDVPKENDSKLLFVLGKNVLGDSLTTELNKMPHLLVAGSTGSGKSVMINALITSILMRAKPDEVKFLMVDPKKVELSIYSSIPHMLAPVISDMKDAAQALKMIVAEMDRRYELFLDNAAKNIEGYNRKVKPSHKLPFIVVIIDELADLMMTGDKKGVEESIKRITQMARAAGIHLVLATQRPSVDIITGTIKTNIPTRIAFSVTTGVDSKTILDTVGAEKLIGRGDMLFMPPGSSELIRAQGAYLSDEEIESVVDYCSSQQQAIYDETFTNLNQANTNSGVGSTENDEPMYEEVKRWVIEQGKASTSLIQRKFNIGYNRAANIVDALEANNIIGPQNGSKPREVLIKKG